MDEITLTWGLVIVVIVNILLDKNWNRPKHVLGMQIFCAYDTVPIRHNINFCSKMFHNRCHPLCVNANCKYVESLKRLTK